MCCNVCRVYVLESQMKLKYILQYSFYKIEYMYVYNFVRVCVSVCARVCVTHGLLSLKPSSFTNTSLKRHIFVTKVTQRLFSGLRSYVRL